MLEVRFGVQLKHPEQPLLQAKPLFYLRNSLHNRKSEDSGNYFIWFVIVLFLLGLIALSDSWLCCNSVNFGVCCISTIFFCMFCRCKDLVFVELNTFIVLMIFPFGTKSNKNPGTSMRLKPFFTLVTKCEPGGSWNPWPHPSPGLLGEVVPDRVHSWLTQSKETIHCIEVAALFVIHIQLENYFELSGVYLLGGN